jgi:predicted GNAT family N-acyltransferase
MRRVEEIAAEQSAEDVWLLARESAMGFYESIGYRAQGPVIVSELTGIPHRRMSLSLR